MFEETRTHFNVPRAAVLGLNFWQCRCTLTFKLRGQGHCPNNDTELARNNLDATKTVGILLLLLLALLALCQFTKETSPKGFQSEGF